MAGAKFQYDESGGTFFYFLLSFLALIVIPCTYYFWPNDRRKDADRRDSKNCHCPPCVLKNSRLRAREPWQKAKQRIIKFLLILGWLALLATAYKVAHIQHDYIQWDPFEILQIDPASSMGEIKKAYRKLSLVFHPDKETGDAKKFMMIAKAYAALTDDEARKNWETYGNPDGPGATSFGIALPSWIVEKENSVWVLGLYALVFMVALPVAVGIWWYRSVKFGGDQVLLDTTQLYYYFVHKTPHMTLKRVIMILSASLEFERGHNSEVVERPSDNVEVPALIRELQNLGEKNKERPLCFGYSIKARALLHAHLSRMKLPPNSLEQDKLYIVKKCPYLLQELVQCVSQLTMLALAGRISRMPNLDTMENAMRLCPMIVQGLWANKSPLLQLPHITEDTLRHFTSRKYNVKSLLSLATMKAKDRLAILRNLSQDQYEDVMNALAKMPMLEMEVRSEVLDDEDSCTITACAIVTVTVTLHRKEMTTVFDQELPTLDNELEESSIHQSEDQHSSVVQEPAPQWKSKDKQRKKKGKGGANKQKKKGQAAIKAGLKKGINKSTIEEATPKTETPSNKLSEERKSKETGDSESAESESEESDREQGGGSSHSSNEGGDGKRPEENSHQEELQNEEEDEDWLKFQQKMAKKDKVLETKSKKSHSVHCPFFPEDKQEYWWIYIANKKSHSLVTVPYLMTNLVDKEEVDLKFTAPSKPGMYTYSVIARSDSYVDFDIVKTIKLDVKEAKKVDMSNPQWEISDEEEDKDQDESAVEDSDLASDDDDGADSPDEE